MRNIRFLLLWIVPVGFAASVPQAVFAQCTCGDTCFSHVTSSGWWHEAANWDNGIPDSSKIACIPANETVVLRSGGGSFDGESKSVVIESSAAVGVDANSTLTLHENSTVNGNLVFGANGIIELAADITVSGSGKIIQEQERLGLPGEIRSASGGSYTLTLSGGCTLEGMVDVYVDLVNNTQVRTCARELTLKGSSSGTGDWIAEGPACGATSYVGRLVVEGGREWKWHVDHSGVAVCRDRDKCRLYQSNRRCSD